MYTSSTFERGFNQHGVVLGHGGQSPENDSKIPLQVACLDNEVVVNVICGRHSTVAFTSSGMVYFCGKNVGDMMQMVVVY